MNNKPTIFLIISFFLALLINVENTEAAVCTVTCSDPTCCTIFGITINTTGTSLNQGEAYGGFQVGITILGLTCTAGDYISFSGGGCSLTVQQNVSTGYTLTTTIDRDRGIKCGNTSCSIATFVYYYNTRIPFILTGSALKDSTIRANLTTDTQKLVSSTAAFKTKQSKINVNLGNPANNSVCIADTDAGTCTFNGTGRWNWTSQTSYTYDNVSLYFNTTKNATATTGTTNYTKAVNINSLLITNWNLLYCYSHNCWWGRDGQINGSNNISALYWLQELWLPINNTNITSTGYSLINATNTMWDVGKVGSKYDNFSILLENNATTLTNESAIFTLTSWPDNISYNFTPITGECGWFWLTTQLCYKDACQKSYNGSINITKDCPSPVVVQKSFFRKIKNFFIDRSLWW